MIWNYIRDFLVQYIFGGTDSERATYSAYIGRFFSSGDEYILEDCNTGDVFLSMKGYSSLEGVHFDYMSIGDWLSTTFTIIIMCMIVVFAIWLVRWVYKTVVSAFLLK